MIKPVLATDILSNAMPLIREHWLEMGFDFDLAPSVEAYAEMQNDGDLFALAAFDGDEIVGYSTAAVGPHLFNPAMIVCQSDAIFIRASHRKGALPGMLIAETEQAAKDKGAHYMVWQTRAGTPLAAMFDRRGYTPADIAYMRAL